MNGNMSGDGTRGSVYRRPAALTPLSLLARPDVDAEPRRIWLLLVLAVAFALRAYNPRFNSAFEDESFMILMGRSVLAHAPDVPIYMRTAFGWYLWPVATALADFGGGIIGVRLLSATLGTAAVLGMYLFARRLFGDRIGLAAAMFFAVCSPAILTSRIATHDAAGVPLLIFALLLFVRGWQNGEWRDWIGSALCFFGCFLVKHPLAVFFPPACILAVLVDRKRGLGFAIVLSLLIATYTVFYLETIRALLVFVAGFNAFRAPSEQLWTIYVSNRLDVWLCAAVALVAAARGGRRERIIIAALFVGAATFAGVHVARRLDYHTWKHAVYALVFLIPAAAAGSVSLADRFMRSQPVPTAACVLIVAGLVFESGRRGLLANSGGLPFLWPNANVVSDFLQARVQFGQRVLVDDAAIRYVLLDQLPRDHIVDQYFFQYGDKTGPAAYAQAVADGWFDYIVLDGTTSSDALALKRAIEPTVGIRYVERNRAMQSNTGEDAVIYERVSPAVTRAPDAPVLVVNTPKTDDTVRVAGPRPTVDVTGHVDRSPPGAVLQVDVFTDRWYQQGPLIIPEMRTGRFSRRVILGGEGAQRCAHVVRVRLLGAANRIIDEATASRIVRSSPDSVGIPCPRAF